MNREYPAVIAVAMQEYEGEQQPFRKFHRLVDVFETIIKYCAVIAIQNFYRAGLDVEYPEVSRRLRAELPRAALGKWLGFLRETMRSFESRPHALFLPELYEFAQRASQGDLKSLTDEFLALRNKYVGHGATLPDNEAQVLTQQHDSNLRRLLQAAEFLTEKSLLYVEAQSDERAYLLNLLMGAGYLETPSQLLQLTAGQMPLPVSHVVLHNPVQNAFLDLHPLLVFAECNNTLSGKLCGMRKLAFLNQLRDEKRIEYLDYWLGHHSRFRTPHPLPSEFLQRFPFPSRIAGSANWFEEFIRDRTAHFVGREAELQAIRTFIENSPKKALLIIGAPGMGKSTLLAKWADENDAPRHFIREGDVQTYDPVSVFRNLALQISQKYQIEWRAPLQPDPSLYREEFEKLLKRAAAKGQVVLVIDGLDEAIRAQTSEKGMEHSQTLVDWLPDPALLPDGVRMILSTRPDLLEHRALAAKCGADKAQHLHLSRLTDAEVRALLFQVHSKYDVLDRDDYVQAIVERSEGSPLYLKRLIDDLAEERIAFGQIDQLPQGVIAYFERTLEFIEREGRARETPDIETHLTIVRTTLENLQQQGILTAAQVEVQLQRERAALEGRAGVKSVALLALFCLAKAPISLDDACAILNASREDAHRAFEVIRTVLTDDGQGRYALFHSAFQDYFLHLERYTDNRFHRHAETIKEVREQLLAYCARWNEHRSPYALRYYAEHLLDANRVDELLPLTDREFLNTQREVLKEPWASVYTLMTVLRGIVDLDPHTNIRTLGSGLGEDAQLGNIKRVSQLLAEEVKNLASQVGVPAKEVLFYLFQQVQPSHKSRESFVLNGKGWAQSLWLCLLYLTEKSWYGVNSLPEYAWKIRSFARQVGLPLQREMVSRGCSIRRVFIVHAGEHLDSQLIQEQQNAGIILKQIEGTRVPSTRIPENERDFAIVDDECVLFIRFRGHEYGDYRVVGARLSRSSEEVQEACEFFEKLWEVSHDVSRNYTW